MALPTNVGSGTVTGRLIDSLGTPIEGKVTFTPSPAYLINETAEPSPVTIIPKPVVVTLSDGSFTTTLTATDDTDNNPSGWTYRVDFNLTGAKRASFSIAVPENETVDLSTVSPVGSSGGVTITRGPAGDPGPGVPAGGSTGQVLAKASGTDFDTEWVAQSGGEGGGVVDSVNGQTGTVVLDAEDVGALPDDTSLFSGDYDDLTNKPSIPATAEDVGARADDWVPSWSDVTSKPSTFTPAAHTHAMSDVTGLSAALAGKADTGALFSGDYDDLDNKPSIPDSPDDIGAVPTTRTVNGKALSANVTLTNSDVGAAATTHTHTAAQVTSGTLDAARIPTLAQSKVTGLETALSDLSDGIDSKMDDGLAGLPPGTVIAAHWDGSDWTYNGQTITARPSSRTDLVFQFIGGTTEPTFAIDGDLWFEDA